MDIHATIVRQPQKMKCEVSGGQVNFPLGEEELVRKVLLRQEQFSGGPK